MFSNLLFLKDTFNSKERADEKNWVNKKDKEALLRILKDMSSKPADAGSEEAYLEVRKLEIYL